MKTRSLLLTLAICLSLSALTVMTFAARDDGDVPYAVEGGNIWFDRETGTVTGCDEGVTAADIPDSIDGAAVVSIGEGAFSWCRQLLEIDIPDTVTKIEAGAFSYCYDLEKIVVESGNTAYFSRDGVLFSSDGRVLHTYPAGKARETYTIPDGVVKIGDEAFGECGRLKELVIPNGVTEIGREAFSDSNIAHISIPNSVTSMGYEAFTGCSGLTDIVIPGSVTYIGDGAFDIVGIDGEGILEKIILPNGIEHIGDGAFTYWLEKSMYIPGSVTYIGEGAFSGNRYLEAIYVDKTNPVYQSKDGVLVTSGGKTLYVYPPAKADQDYSVPEGVTEIAGSAFEGCENIHRLYIPESVRTVGPDALRDLRNLTDIYYSGSPEQWELLMADGSEGYPLSVTVHCNTPLSD